MLADIIEKLPAFAKDIKLNLQSVLTEAGSPGLNVTQICQVSLAAAYATHNKELFKKLVAELADNIPVQDIEAVQCIVALTVMNNIYYRSLAIIKNDQLKEIPTNLRMSFLATKSLAKESVGLISLAPSIINHCAVCINGHINELLKAGVGINAIHSVLRITATISSVAQLLNET